MKNGRQTIPEKIVVACAYCSKLLKRNDNWEYDKGTGVKSGMLDVSHSICPDCLKENFPREYLIIQEEKKAKMSQDIEEGLKDFYGHITK